jgi:putative transposase
VVTPEQRRTAVTLAKQTAGVSERRACRFTGFARSSQRYRTCRAPDTPLRERLRELATKKPRWGYRQLTRVLRREPGPRINYKRVQRLYQQEDLQVRRRRRKHRAQVPRVRMPVPTQPNERWSMDFVRDTLGDGRAFRSLTIVGEGTRESPAIEVDFSLPGERVVAVLDQLASLGLLAKTLLCDNGPEFAGKALDEWAYRHGVKLDFVDPGKPTQNAFIESFNGTFREECLNENWFVSLADAQHTIETWRVEYNTERPHSRLRDCTPREFALNLTSTAVSSINPTGLT